MKIGVYGGTFNPPHLGHVTAARAVFELLKLDLLLLVPDREPPHKALPAGSPTPEQRLEMTRLAGEPRQGVLCRKQSDSSWRQGVQLVGRHLFDNLLSKDGL